jgi:hypothetical protein
VKRITRVDDRDERTCINEDAAHVPPVVVSAAR